MTGEKKRKTCRSSLMSKGLPITNSYTSKLPWLSLPPWRLATVEKNADTYRSVWLCLPGDGDLLPSSKRTWRDENCCDGARWGKGFMVTQGGAEVWQMSIIRGSRMCICESVWVSGYNWGWRKHRLLSTWLHAHATLHVKNVRKQYQQIWAEVSDPMKKSTKAFKLKQE